jgi:putative tryptophan/tyrosine transport system substrate-binding protein
MIAQIKRRDFITLCGGAAALAWPLVARAQQPRRIGVLLAGDPTDPENQNRTKALEAGLRDLGWISGRNLKIDYRWTADASSLRTQAAELVAAKSELIVATNSSALVAAQRATGTIPIVFNSVTDPVAQGFVASLAQPGGNSTGFSHWQSTMGGKWLELLKETAPEVTHVSVVFNPDTATYAGLFLPTMEAAAHSLAALTVGPIHDSAGMERAFASVASQTNGGLVLLPDAFTWSIRRQVVALAARYRLPAIYQYGHIAREGGLMSYGIDPADVFRQTATYVDRILNGAKPADLPVQLPTKFELVINLKTAKALGLEVPPQLLARADEVIE